MNHKQVIVIRKDLNMRKGKITAQGAHASEAAVLSNGFVAEVNEKRCLCIPLTVANEPWLTTNFKKVVVSVNSEAELKEIHAKATAAGIECSLILDSGLTEFGGVHTYTAVAVGPDVADKIDPITGGLPLL